MNVLVIAEHDNAALKSATLNAVTAAARLGGALHLLVAGSGCGTVVEAASRVADVSQVLVADAPQYEHQLAEPLAPLIAGIAGDYVHGLASAPPPGKNVLPRLAALLVVAQIPDIIGLDDAHTFTCPITPAT